MSEDGQNSTDEAPNTANAGPAGTVEHRSPEELFGLLGNETRIEILSALAEDPEEPTSFSRLQDRVQLRDSGQFNYHLGKLAGHFVRKTEDGYTLTMAGVQVVGAIRAGRYTADVSIDPIDLEDACPRCDGRMEATYEDEHAYLRCRECEEFTNKFAFPPGTVDQFDRESLPFAFDRWLKTSMESTVAGFCPNCSGRVAGHLEPHESDGADPCQVVYTCGRCGDVAQFNPVGLVWTHPAARAFYFEHGVDVSGTPTWAIERRHETTVDVLDDDPLRAKVEIRLGEERLLATIDETASIESIERVRD